MMNTEGKEYNFPEELLEEDSVAKTYQFDAFEKALKPYHLDSHAIQEMQRLYSLLYHKAAGDAVPDMARSALFVRCDVEVLALEMLRACSEELFRQNLVEAPCKEYLEREELPKNSDGKSSRLLIIHGCKRVSSVDSSMTNKEKKLAKNSNEEWNEYWEKMCRFAAEHPAVIPVVIVPTEVEENTWRERTFVYRRLFSYHISLRDLPVGDILEMTNKAIAALGLSVSKGFSGKLEKYITVVYPKAELKGQEFVEDLVRRMVLNYYAKKNLDNNLTPRCIPFYRQPQPVEAILKRLDELVGMNEVRTALEDLYYQSPLQTKGSARRRMHMAFEGNPGTGKSTVAQMMADLLYQMGVIKKAKLTVKKPVDFISPHPGQTAIQTREICQSALDGVLFIDEAYSFIRGNGASAATAQECIDTLIHEMEQRSDRLVVIFAGYTKPIEELLNANKGLRSRVPHIIHFRDFTDQELLQIFLRMAAKEGMTVAEEAMQALEERLAFERTMENFGNARSVENVFQWVLGSWNRTPNESNIITEAHIRATMPQGQSSDISNMISLGEMKQQLQELESRVRYIRVISEKGMRVPPINLHMLFVGNPGTGKTTVAKVIAEDFYKIGILKSNKCISVGAMDIIGDYDHAVENMTKYINQAIGGVLFIDEAYALTSYASRMVGAEVITVLLTAMEDHKQDLVVIFAGYERLMRNFLAANKGLASRIGSTFYFPDYSPDELTEMFLRKMQGFGYIVTEEVPARVWEVMEYFHVIDDFGNGRFVDMLMDQTITKRSLRGIDDICAYNEITADDIPTIEEVLQRQPDGRYYWKPAAASEEARKRFAIHEMGHAIVSIVLSPEITLTTISISAQADSGGRIGWIPGQDNLTEPQLMADIAVSLAGRGAERLVLGSHSTGCSGDYQMAKDVAFKMVDRWAMGGPLGATDYTVLLRIAENIADKVLMHYEGLLRELAQRLYEQMELPDEEVREALSKAEPFTLGDDDDEDASEEAAESESAEENKDTAETDSAEDEE